jgi:epsilon-lactone hydrolase
VPYAQSLTDRIIAEKTVSNRHRTLTEGCTDMASREFHQLVETMRARPRPADPTIGELRAGFETLRRAYGPPSEISFEAVDANGVPAEWTLPGKAADPATVLLYFHGGGYCISSIASHRGLVGRLAQAAGVRALSVGYRLAPEHRFPAAVDDALTAYRWLRVQLGAKGKIVVAGDSAGGGLALALLVALRDAGDVLPIAAVCMSPSTDLAKEGESMVSRAALDPMVQLKSSTIYAQHYLGPNGDPKNPLASPLYANLAGLPPILILVGTWEVLLDDSMRFADRAKKAGVDVQLEVWEEMVHIWPFFAPTIPEATQAIEQMGTYIRNKTKAKT